MGKKSREVMAKERASFESGCEAAGYGRALGERLFDVIAKFADYAFNKSHTFGYGLVTYQTAYLKVHYPVEYLACLLTSVKGNLDRAAVYLSDARSMGVKVLTPDINRSVTDYAALMPDQVPDSVPLPIGSPGAITFGLSAIRNVGVGLVAQLLTERDANGEFSSFHDFVERVPEPVLNKRTVESLIKAGAFDAMGHPRQGLALAFERIVDHAVSRRREIDAGIMSLFGGGGEGNDAIFTENEKPPIPDAEFDKLTRLAFEKEMLGLYVSDHPLMGAEAALSRYVDGPISELRETREGEMRTVGGVCTSLNRRYTKRGDLMATFTLEDLGASIEVMVFPKTMTEYGHLLAVDAIVVIRGRVDARDDVPKVMAMEIARPELVIDGGPPVRLRLKMTQVSDEKVNRLKALLSAHPGESPVFLHLESPEKTTVIRLGDEHLVDARNGLYAELRVLLGPDCIVG
jgi:DNA polymerase-3 subunit alpha